MERRGEESRGKGGYTKCDFMLLGSEGYKIEGLGSVKKKKKKTHTHTTPPYAIVDIKPFSSFFPKTLRSPSLNLVSSHTPYFSNCFFSEFGGQTPSFFPRRLIAISALLFSCMLNPFMNPKYSHFRLSNLNHVLLSALPLSSLLSL